MNAQQFREQYANDRGYLEWGEMHMDAKDVDSLESDVMNAFAAYKIEEVREKANEKAILAIMGCKIQVVDMDDLNNIFEQTLKELK